MEYCSEIDLEFRLSLIMLKILPITLFYYSPATHLFFQMDVPITLRSLLFAGTNFSGFHDSLI